MKPLLIIVTLFSLVQISTAQDNCVQRTNGTLRMLLQIPDLEELGYEVLLDTSRTRMISKELRAKSGEYYNHGDFRVSLNFRDQPVNIPNKSTYGPIQILTEKWRETDEADCFILPTAEAREEEFITLSGMINAKTARISFELDKTNGDIHVIQSFSFDHPKIKRLSCTRRKVQHSEVTQFRLYPFQGIVRRVFFPHKDRTTNIITSVPLRLALWKERYISWQHYIGSRTDNLFDPVTMLAQEDYLARRSACGVAVDITERDFHKETTYDDPAKNEKREQRFNRALEE